MVVCAELYAGVTVTRRLVRMRRGCVFVEVHTGMCPPGHLGTSGEEVSAV